MRKREDQIDEFGVGDPRNIAMNKKLKKMMKKKKKGKKGTKSKKRRKSKGGMTDRKHKYGTDGTDAEYTDVDDDPDSKFTLYMNNNGHAMESPHVFDPITGTYITKGATSDEEKKKKRKVFNIYMWAMYLIEVSVSD